MSGFGRFGGFRYGVALLVVAVAMAACSSSSGSVSPTTAGGRPTGGGGPGATVAGASTGGNGGAALPFGDTCKALEAADFTPLGLTLTVANHGISNVAEVCFYQVTAADGTTASPSVQFFPDNNFEAARQIYGKSTFKYKTVSGIGDAAYTYTTLNPVLWVQAKGHVFNIEAIGLGGSVGSGDPEADIEALAKAIVGRL